MNDAGALIDRMLADPRHGWSMGTFGAIGEFIRHEDEEALVTRNAGRITVVTPRAGISVTAVEGLRVIAFDTLSSDGETWGQSVLFCLPLPGHAEHEGVRWLGKDTEALREEDREGDLFDLGVGRGHVRFCVRTRDARLIEALRELEGKKLFGPEGAKVGTETLRAQPHRVVTSPVGRVEVYAPIPMPGGSSPEGPHTHLLPKMVATGKTHASNSPVPSGFQPVLAFHPRSPWRDERGRRVPFDADLDSLFQDILARFALPDDLEVRRKVERAVNEGTDPAAFEWPSTRRGRIAARITLRRLARAEPLRAAPWRQKYDRLPDPETDEEAALHA